MQVYFLLILQVLDTLVKIADGSLATVAGTGTKLLGPHITLFYVLNVPNYHVICCLRKSIDSAEEYGGLYFFKEDNTKDGQVLSAGCESS